MNKIKKTLFAIERMVPYIPNFGNLYTIVKIIIVSFFLCAMYSFSQVEYASDFYNVFMPNLSTFYPYVVAQLILLIVFAKLISKSKPIVSLILLIILNFISVYIVNSIEVGTFNILNYNWDRINSKLVLSLGVLFFFIVYLDWRQKNIDPVNTMSRLIFLQSKMRPHFLFNTLNSILALIKRNPNAASKMLLNLSTLLRASLKEDEYGLYSLQEEIGLCNSYLDIEKVRLEDRLVVEWDIDEDLLDYKLPRLTIQPLIENSILHGIQHRADGGTVYIKIEKRNKNKIAIIIKNPLGRKIAYEEDKHNNISLKNIKERMRLYFNESASFKSGVKDDLYEVELVFPKTI